MERYVAVQIQYPRLSYAELVHLRRRHRSQVRLAPIEIDQQVAVVKLFLMRSATGAGGSATPERELHTFRVSSLPSGSQAPPILTLSAEYDGARAVHCRLDGNGMSPQTAELRVPRHRRWWWIPLVVLLVLGIATFMLIPGWSVEMRGGGSHGERIPVTRQDGEPATPEAAITREAPREATPEPEPEAASEPEPEAAPEPAADLAPELPDTALQVYFGPNQTQLTAATRRELDELVEVLREYPQVPVTIVGHTALYGTEEGRLEISQGRAEGVATYLRDQGWRPANEPSVRWVGSRDPITRERDAQQQNRRVEISVGEDQSSR